MNVRDAKSEADLDLFSYPHQAGYREATTSKENAERIERSGKAATLRAKVRKFFEDGRQATADEIAAYLNESPFAVRPRLSELRARDLIEPTGERRRNPAGGTAHVWKWK